MDLALRRRFFAEEIEAVAKLRTAALVEAFAIVPREGFMPAGPWTVLADADFGMGPVKTRQTPDADPARICHNIAVAIDPARQLFNGQPSTIGGWIDMLAPGDGARVLHVGCGLGYYTAVVAHCVGERGRALGLEADADLADRARRNLASMPWVEVRGTADAQVEGETFDAILINAGVTHPLPSWLDALAIGGRMMMPLTATMPAMGTIGKGLVMLVTRQSENAYSAQTAGFVAIYSAVGIRDDVMNERLGAAMKAGPQIWGSIARLRRDPHETSSSCWLHGTDFCVST